MSGLEYYKYMYVLSCKHSQTSLEYKKLTSNHYFYKYYLIPMMHCGNPYGPLPWPYEAQKFYALPSKSSLTPTTGSSNYIPSLLVLDHSLTKFGLGSRPNMYNAKLLDMLVVEMSEYPL